MTIDSLTGLVRLSPFSGDIGGSPLYYRILGSETTLTYVREILQHPEQDKRYRGYDRAFTNNIEQVILSLQGECTNPSPLTIHEWETFVTARNYARRTNQAESVPELRSRFQQYLTLYSNAHKNLPLTEREEALKQEFVTMLDFFITLEQRYDEWTAHISSLDDE